MGDQVRMHSAWRAARRVRYYSRCESQVYYAMEGKSWRDGDKVVRGQMGEVTGPSASDPTVGVKVLLPGNRDSIGFRVTELSFRPLPSVEDHV